MNPADTCQDKNIRDIFPNASEEALGARSEAIKLILNEGTDRAFAKLKALQIQVPGKTVQGLAEVMTGLEDYVIRRLPQDGDPELHAALLNLIDNFEEDEVYDDVKFTLLDTFDALESGSVTVDVADLLDFCGKRLARAFADMEPVDYDLEDLLKG